MCVHQESSWPLLLPFSPLMKEYYILAKNPFTSAVLKRRPPNRPDTDSWVMWLSWSYCVLARAGRGGAV